MPDSNNPYASDTSSARLRQLSAMLPHPGPLTQAEVDAANAAPVAVAPAAPAAPPPPSPGIAAWFQRSAPSAPIAQGSAPAPDAGRAQLTPGSIEESVLAAVPPDTTSTNAPAAPSPTGVISKNLEGQEYVRETQRQEQTRPKTAGEANLLSKATKGMFIPDYEGNFHLNGKLMTPADVQKKYPDVWAKINAPKPPVAPVAAQTPEEAHGILDQVLHKLSPAVQADANGDEKTIGDWARSVGDTAKDAAQYATDHPGAVPVDLLKAIPKGTYKFGQMVWGGYGGITQAMGDMLSVGQYGLPPGSVALGKWMSSEGAKIRHFVDSKDVSEAMGIGEKGGETPFGRFSSGLFSLAPALGLGKVIELGTLYGATGAGETYGHAEDFQTAMREQAIADGKPDPGISHAASAAAALVAGATNYLVGKEVPKGLAPDAVNPLFREALPRNLAQAALSAAQLTVGHNVARSIYDPAAQPKDWMDALDKVFDGYAQSLASLMTVHAVSAYAAYRVANIRDYQARQKAEQWKTDPNNPYSEENRAKNIGQPGFDSEGWPTAPGGAGAARGGEQQSSYERALLRGQDPFITNGILNQIAEAKTAEEAEMIRQRIRAWTERVGTKETKQAGGVFLGHFDTLFPPITAENWSNWGPQIPGVTVPERAPDAAQVKAKVEAETAAEPQPAAIPTQPVSREGIEAPKPAVQPSALGKTALDLANERVSKTPKNVLQITTHPNAVRLTDSNGEENRPETITNHTPDTSHMVANRAVANTMRAVMYGSMRIAGVDPETEPDAKKAVENIVNGFSGSRAATKIATAWGQMGVPPVMIDALNATTATLMAQGIDLNRPTVGADTRPIPADVAARRGFEFATEFHKQLDERVHNMGVEAPDWMRDTVARIGKIVEPGGPHDNAVRAGLGLPPAELVPQHVTTPPIVKPMSIGDLNKMATRSPENPTYRITPWTALKMTRDFVQRQIAKDGGALGSTSGGDVDRQWARYVDKYFNKMPEQLRDFWIGRKARDFETGATHMVGFPDETGSDGEVHGAHIYDLHEEVALGQEAERSTGGQAVQTQEGGAGRGAVAAGAPEGAATQPGQAEAGGGPGAVLGTDHGPAIAAEPGAGPGNEAPAAANAGAVQRSGAQAAADADADPDVRHLSPAMQARVDASVARMKALLEESGVPGGNVSSIDPHTEMLQSTNWSNGLTPARDSESIPASLDHAAGAPRVQFVGPAEMLYPPPVGSPYTHPFNLTSSVAISPEMLVAMGLPPLGDVPSIGTVVHALINASPERLKTVYAALAAMGFDSIASTVSAHGVGVVFSAITEAGSTKSGAPFLGRPWGKRPDGRIGFLSMPDDEVFGGKKGSGPKYAGERLGETKIEFVEHPGSYAARTAENAKADVTIAMAKDFATAGERSTKNAVATHGKLYVPIALTKDYMSKVGGVVNQLNGLGKPEITLNIAGNGIYTLGKTSSAQGNVDKVIHEFLKAVVESPDLKVKITQVVSGGQTGVDEAGSKAAEALGIPSRVVAPKGWKFRNVNGVDISNEPQFKQRFMPRLPAEPELTQATPEPKLPDPVPQIEDEAERDKAIQASRELFAKHHVDSMKLIESLRPAGVPMGDEEMELASAKGIEDGVSTADLKDLMQVVSQDQGTSDAYKFQKPTKGVSKDEVYSAEKFRDYAKAGGLLHVIRGLRRNEDFMKDIKSGKRIGRKEFTRVAAGSAVPLVGGQALGSNKVYSAARMALRDLVAREGTRYDEEGAPSLGGDSVFDEIAKELAEKRITPDTTRTLALLSLAAQEYIPHFFSADPHYISDMRMREVQKPELPKLASYFEPRVEDEGNFAPSLDVYENREVMREAQQGAGHEDVVHTTMAKHISPARRQQLLNQVQDALGARGMSTPDTLGKLGVPLVPRIDHATLHEDTVTKILESPEAEAKILRAVDKEGFKFLTELAPSHLISNGYCGLLLNRLAGMGKRPFHLQAYTSDPNFENHYTIGEETILGLNEYSPDGAPAMESILTHDDMAILLDHNDPRYDTTVERVHSQLANDPQLNGCVTTMRRVVEVTPQGREISRMLPVSRVHANYSRVQTVLPGMGLAPAAQQSTWRGLRIKDPALVRQRLALALGAIIDGDIAWHQKLGGELCEQLATAETALEAVEKADLYALTKGAKGSEKEFGDLTGVASRIAEDAFNDYMGPISKQLRKFVKDTHNRLKAIEDSRVVHAIETPKKIEAIINRLMDEENEKGDVDSALVKAAQKEIDALPHEEDIEAQDALTEAEHVTSGLIRAKNDTPWHEIFPDDGTAMIPGLKPETCITNKAQMMAIVHEMGITADDPKTKYMHEVFAKMHPAVFREMGFQIDMSPDCDTGWFDFRRRLVGISGKLKEMSATRAAIVMAHELSHAFTAYMPLQMQRVLDRWYESEFAKVEAKNPRFADVMKADSISQATNETRSVKMSFTIGGTKANVLVTPDAGKALLEKHPDLKGSLREQFDRSGNTIGYALRSDFAGHSMYRYLSPAEFIAEVGLDAIRYHANGRATGRREVSRHMVDMGPGARAAFNTTWRNIGREIDAIVGKTTMRRFIGNAMSRKIDPNVVNLEKPGYIDHLIPGAPANGPPIHKGDTPEDYAASKYDLASSIGELLAIPRRRIVMAFHTASASDAARNMQYITRPENGFETQLVLSAGGMTAKHYDAIEKMTSPTGADRRALIKALKETPEGQAVSKAAKKSGFAKNIKLMGEKEPFWVKVGPDGKYKRAMTERALMMQDDFVKTGKLPDEFKELEEAMPKLSEFMWHRLQGDLVELCDAIGVPLDSMQSVEDKIIHQGTPPPDTVGQRATPKVKHYIPQVWDGNKQTGIVQNLFGVAPKNKEGLPAAKGVDASSEMGAGTAAREYGFDAPQDINLSAFMLHQREYDGPLDGVQHDRFPLNTNLIDQSNHGTGSAGLVSMAFRVITNALRTGQARIGLPLDKNDPASGFVKLNLKTLGMPDGLLPDAFDNIYINPDALRQMKSAMAPNPFSGSKLYRGVVLLNTAFNSVMLAGLFDWVNGAMMTAHFAADLPVELSRKLEADKRNLKGFDSTANKAAIAGAVAGLVAGGALGGAGMSASGATMGYLGIRALAGLYKARRMMYGGFGDLAAKGREVQNLIESGVQLNPKELPPKTQDFLAAWQVMNPKMMSSPTQIKRSQHLYKALWRNGQWGQATGMALVRAAGKLSLYGDNGLFKAIPGKQQFKQGMLAFAIEGINDRFRDAEGNLDRTNKQWMDALFEISDSSDELIGSAQARNLNQNQTMYAVAQTLFIAWNFTYPTIKAMSIVGADLANNLLGWSGHYRAFKSAATGGGTRQSLPTEGSNWTQRKSTMALKQSFLVGIILARLMSIASHYVYPHSHYTMARAASVAEHEISRQKGTLLGATWGGLATAAPPEGMGIWDSMRHTAFESMAPQLGRDVPSVMRPQRFVPIGAHYLPDIINPMIHPSIHPSILFNYEVQMNRLAEFYKSKSSGVSSSVQAVTTGHDPLGRPLALTGSMANTGWGRAFNKATAAHEGDGFIRDNARAFSRSLAYLISSKLPLTERGFAKGKESGDYTRLTTGLAGSRSLPIGFTLDTEAERIAYDAMVGKIAGHTSGHTEIEADRIASAKQDLIEKLDSTKLQKLQDDRTITPSEYKRIKRSYFNPTTGQLRNPLIVMLRSAEDKNKTVWRQVYRAATDRQRDLMEDYIAGHEGSGYAAEAKEKNALLLDWMKTYRKRNPILREVW